jgi:hypothetical protein
MKIASELHVDRGVQYTYPHSGDFNDLHCNLGLEEVLKQFKANLTDGTRSSAQKAAHRVESPLSSDADSLTKTNPRTGETQLVKQSLVARILIKKGYFTKVLYNSEVTEWLIYSDRIWKLVSAEDIFKKIDFTLEAECPGVGYDSFTVLGIVNFLKRLENSNWDTDTNLIPLQNGVFNIETRDFLPHNPRNHSTWKGRCCRNIK